VDGTISASATSICVGQSVTVSSTGGVGTPYYWASTNGGSSWDVFQQAYGGQTSFTHTPAAAGTYRYHLRNRTNCGFCWDVNNCNTYPYVDVVVHPKPVDGTIAASRTSINLGESVTISSVGGTGAPHYWCSSDSVKSWNVFAAQYGGQYSFQHTPASPGVYHYHLRNRSGCGFCWDAGNCGEHRGVNVNVTIPAPEAYANLTLPVLPNSSITASSCWEGGGACAGGGHESWRARLFDKSGPANWSSQFNDANQYLQVDLGAAKPVNGILTQGRYNHDQWVTSYKLSYSTDGTTWLNYPQTFSGNNDRHTVVRNLIEVPFVARYVRIKPVAWYGHISMRADVISVPTTDGNVTFMAAQPGGTDSNRWYSSPTGGTPLATGKVYTAALTGTTTRYASAYNAATGWESSARTAVAGTLEKPVTGNEQMQAIFQHVDKTQVPTGLLADYGMPLADLSAFPGTLNSSNYVDLLTWRLVYAALYTSQVNGNASLASLEAINSLVEVPENLLSAQSPDHSPVRIPILHYRYNALREDAVDQRLMRVENNQIYDVAGRTQSPYLARTVFAACPSVAYDEDGVVDFRLAQDLFYTNLGGTVSSVQVDFGDGQGYVPVAWNTTRRVTYPATGEKTVRVKLSYADGTATESQSRFHVLAVPAQSASGRYGTERAFQEVPFNPIAGVHAGGLVTVQLSVGNQTGRLRRPLIVVEGYDPGRFFPGYAYNFEHYVGNPNRLPRPLIGDIEIDWPTGAAARDFDQALDNIGQYDLVFLNYNDGTDDIRRNAALLQEVIRWVNDQKRQAGSTERNVVMGYSMGGLVARFALCQMASEGVDTQTRLLVSHDSPHRGANVPLGFQAMVNELAGMRIGGIPLGVIVPPLRNAIRLLNAPASRQLLLVQDGRENTFLDGEYRQMVDRDIPGCRIVAVANGSECGQALFQPYREIFRLKSNLYINPLTWAATSVVANTTLGVVAGVPVVGPMVAGPAAVVVNAALLAVLPFVGTNWKSEFSVHALPDRQVRNVFHGRIAGEKRFFGLFKLFEVTFWERDRNSRADLLPWDSAPGGFYDLESVSGRLPGVDIDAFPFLSANLEIDLAPSFNFVPTVSALDVTTVNANTIAARYNSGISPTNPLQRIDNFIAQDRFFTNTGEEQLNTRHIRITPDNSQWIYNEMQNVTPNPFNCSTDCPPDVNVTASSPVVCAPNEVTLSVTDAGAGSGYTWTVGNGLQLVGGQNTRQVVVQATPGFTGTSQATARVTTPGGCVFIAPALSLTVGGSYLPGTYRVNSGPAVNLLTVNQVSDGSLAVTIDEPNATNWQWTVQSGTAMLNGTGNSRSFNLSSGQSVTIAVSASLTNCGSVTRTISFSASSSTTMAAFTVYPNPTGGELQVEAQSTQVAGQEADEPFEVVLFNSYGQRIGTNRSRHRKVRFDVAKLPKGFYYLQIKQGGHTTTRQVRIER